MSYFKTAEHICSWAGLCPGNNESAGKRKSTSITKGNPYIKVCFVKLPGSLLESVIPIFPHGTGESSKRKGLKKAIVALARKLLVIIYTMLKQGTLFDENCFETRRKNCEQKQVSHYIRELEKRGYHIEASA